MGTEDNTMLYITYRMLMEWLLPLSIIGLILLWWKSDARNEVLIQNRVVVNGVSTIKWEAKWRLFDSDPFPLVVAMMLLCIWIAYWYNPYPGPG